MLDKPRFPSGKFLFRPGPQIHGALIEAAAQRDISVNHLASDIISRALGLGSILFLDFKDHIDAGSLTSQQAQDLTQYVHGNLSPNALLIAGGVNSGRTSFQAALLREFQRSDRARILVINPLDPRYRNELISCGLQNASSYFIYSSPYEGANVETDDYPTECDRLATERKAFLTNIARQQFSAIFIGDIRTWQGASLFMDLALYHQPVIATIHATPKGDQTDVFGRMDYLQSQNPFWQPEGSPRRCVIDVWTAERLEYNRITFTKVKPSLDAP